MQRPTKIPKLLDARINILDPAGKEIPHFSARRHMVPTKRTSGELVNIVQRQAQRLRLLDELHLLFTVRRWTGAPRAEQPGHKCGLDSKCVSQSPFINGSINPEVHSRVNRRYVSKNGHAPRFINAMLDGSRQCWMRRRRAIR